MSSAVDILIPTCNRPYALAMTLTSLASQTVQNMRIHVSDQSDHEDALERPEVLAVRRWLNATGHEIHTYRHLPRLGMAEQRAFLLSKVSAPYCLFLDDDVLLENDLVGRLLQAITEQKCGFVGSALHGLSYADHARPDQQHIEFWEAGVEPELVSPESPAWARHCLHNAANLFHVQQKFGFTRDNMRYYRVAWIGGCVLFDTAKLREAGGFDFWEELPPQHCGEDVLAQLRVMARFGGCGIIPSGAYHMELPTTVQERPIDAPHVLWQRAQPQHEGWNQHA
ncbi:MAG TPA: glycosyltransferase [Methylophilaceae bacterium]|nr:glycosyltransferase [Methylophilaceae bacterium]